MPIYKLPTGCWKCVLVGLVLWPVSASSLAADSSASPSSRPRAAADAFYDELEHDPARLQAEIRQRFEAILRQAQDLRLRLDSDERVLQAMSGRDSIAEGRLRAELKQVREQYARLNQMLPSVADRERLARRLVELKEDIHGLRSAGKDAEADKLQRDATEIMAAMVGLHPKAAQTQPKPQASRYATPTASRSTPKPASPATAATPEPTTADLQAEVQSLRAEVDQLRRQLNRQAGQDNAAK